MDQEISSSQTSYFWCQGVRLALSQDPLASQALDKIRTIAEIRFSKMQFDLLKDETCLKLFKRAEAAKGNMLLSEWELDDANLITPPLTAREASLNLAQQNWAKADADYYNAAEQLQPGFKRARMRLELCLDIQAAHLGGARLPKAEKCLLNDARKEMGPQHRFSI